MIIKPYKACKPSHQSQGFHSNHNAVDYAYKYGTLLVAPEDCEVVRYRGSDNYDNYEEELMGRGYSIRLRSLDGKRDYVYAHCLPNFPVEEGQGVSRGQIVAQMGNSGSVKVKRRGENWRVPSYEEKTVPPYPGTHIHFWMIKNQISVDCRDYIDWDIPVNYTEEDKQKALEIVANKRAEWKGEIPEPKEEDLPLPTTEKERKMGTKKERISILRRILERLMYLIRLKK